MRRILVPTLTAAFLTGCACEKRSTSVIIPAPGATSNLQRPAILQQPETITAEAGTFVVFSVRVANPKNARYQWRFNERNISKANKRELFINRASVKNVGVYSVAVTWPNAKLISTNAFLSVYKLAGTNSTSGTLTTPIGVFATSGPSYYCPNYPTILFDRYYRPADDAGNFYFFYGPNVPLSSQSGPFVNSGHNRNLTIDSFSASNGARPTGVQLIRGFGTPPYELLCEAGATGAGLSLTGLATSSDPTQARYRVVVYYQSPAPPSGTISFNWLYNDNSPDY